MCKLMCDCCGGEEMATNLGLDDAAIEDARLLGGHKTKRRKQGRIVELFGTIDYDPAYDYKAARLSKTRDDSF